MLQVHGIYTIYFSFLYFAFFWTRLIYLPWKPAKWMCWNHPPKWPAKIIRRGNLPDLGATLTRGIYSPEIGAISTRGIGLPENPPSPLRIPRQDPARHPPPPQHLRMPEEGGGGRRLARLAHASWTGTFTFIPSHEQLHIPYDTTYTHSIQSGLWMKV